MKITAWLDMSQEFEFDVPIEEIMKSIQEQLSRSDDELSESTKREVRQTLSLAVHVIRKAGVLCTDVIDKKLASLMFDNLEQAVLEYDKLR